MTIWGWSGAEPGVTLEWPRFLSLKLTSGMVLADG